MTRLLMAALAALLFGLAPAAAQERNLVIEYFRAYRAALEAGNLPAAEEAAEQALGASEYRDGGGGRTAVLALNLALVRLMQNDHRRALEPARRALNLAEARDGDSGVSLALAQIALGRAELGGGHENAGVERLLAALPQAENDPEIVSDAYAASFELSAWLFQNRRYAEARESWARTARLAEGSPVGAEYGRGRALAFEGASIILLGVSRRSHRLSADEANIAENALREAMILLSPLSARVGEGGGMTIAQAAYAEALVWRGVLRSQLGLRDRVIERDDDDAGEGRSAAGAEYAGQIIVAPGGDLTVPVCQTRLQPRPFPNYPSSALDDLNVGSVVIRVQFSEAGHILDRRIAASVGGDAFVRAVEEVLPRWSVETLNGAPPQCRMPAAALIPVRFAIR